MRNLIILSLAILVAAADPRRLAPLPRQPAADRRRQRQLPDKLDILWKFKVGDGIEATAAIVSGVVYIGSYRRPPLRHRPGQGQGEVEVQGRLHQGPARACMRARVYVGDEDGHVPLRRRRQGQEDAGPSRPAARSPRAPTSPATTSCSARTIPPSTASVARRARKSGSFKAMGPVNGSRRRRRRRHLPRRLRQQPARHRPQDRQGSARHRPGRPGRRHRRRRRQESSTSAP